MQTAAHALTQQFLAWVAEAPRSYADAEAWRRSCPHLSIWEDAISDGLVRFQNGSSMGQSLLVLTARGRAGAARSALSRPSHFFAHDLDRKPFPIPDQVEDMLFGIMRYCGTTSPRPTLTRLASSEPSGFFSARTMAICAPGLSSALSPIT